MRRSLAGLLFGVAFAFACVAVSGFLMPVLLGQFEAGATRHTFEQPVDRWIEDLAAAGFDPTVEIIHDYWWGPAFCLEA